MWRIINSEKESSHHCTGENRDKQSYLTVFSETKCAPVAGRSRHQEPPSDSAAITSNCGFAAVSMTMQSLVTSRNPYLVLSGGLSQTAAEEELVRNM